VVVMEASSVGVATAEGDNLPRFGSPGGRQTGAMTHCRLPAASNCGKATTNASRAEQLTATHTSKRFPAGRRGSIGVNLALPGGPKRLC
jgi:hypothetical protein